MTPLASVLASGLGLANLTLVAASPLLCRDRPWKVRAVPFVVAAAAVVGGTAGMVEPVTGAAVAAAVLLHVISMIVIGLTVIAHRMPPAPGRLLTSGPYRVVRHPLYGAFVLALVGCALAMPHPLTAVAAVHGAVALDRSARREDRRLLRSAPGYGPYMARTGRLVPLVGRVG